MDLSDYELDVADDAYDDPNPTATGAKRASGYQLTNVLKLPRATTYSTQALYDQIHAGDINLEPEYQRDVVWPESKQIGLVDSIFRNFYVPPVIFVSHQHEDGSETKTCIDGKQRLTSIQRFMDGQIPHRDPTTGTKYWYKKCLPGRGQVLPDRYKRLFTNKQVVCVEYQDLPDSEEREIFQRVQLGMALTPAEKLQVINSPMAAFVRKLQAQYFASGSPFDAQVFEWDRSRGGEFRCIAQTLYVIAKYPTITSIGTIVQLEKWLHNPVVRTTKGRKKTRSVTKKRAKLDLDSDEDEDEEQQDLSQDASFLARVHATMSTFSKLVGDESLHAHFLRPEWRVAPVEFVMISLLISVDKDALTTEALAVRIGEMRMWVRKEHVDVRMNTRVAKTMFEFIQEKPSTTSVPIAGSSSTPTSTAGVGIKRKREEEEEMTGVETVWKLEPPPTPNVPATPGVGTRTVMTTTTTTPQLPPPPRPDRLLAVRATKEAIQIAPPRVTPPQTLTQTLIAPPRVTPPSNWVPATPSSWTEAPLPASTVPFEHGGVSFLA